ncbi:J domain-containing protein KNAG_0A05650 [Huiozyma naganishii CBS 8797]|uniref:J domain-containing protein n=1 Tax=Huiozyma naganishii (strain ATCC MYA-139 / BCRC 22969 / CBS 8797 / KCTC 17520 / NBRC 10181 / NCYC 3082 / Yp74L-3) TaxID=1071383 RepID=J7S2K8_HUIN7|nr:hypothetical protein KNAG_0A05650 [Kazachstania naganishii CBS 8797]CCK68229.1 hypothetical protein KNAG_0A05650 [Kazachstania naganishii CBS 8797]
MARVTSSSHTNLNEQILSKENGTYYDVIGVDIGVSQRQLKMSYKELITKLHPDKNSSPGAKEAFALVHKAYKTLSNKQKRAMYDKYGNDAFSRKTDGSADKPFNSRDPHGAVIDSLITSTENGNMAGNFISYQNSQHTANNEEKQRIQTFMETAIKLLPLVVICLLPVLEILLFE